MFCKNLPTPDDVKLSKFRLSILIKKKKKKKKNGRREGNPIGPIKPILLKKIKNRSIWSSRVILGIWREKLNQRINSSFASFFNVLWRFKDRYLMDYREIL